MFRCAGWYAATWFPVYAAAHPDLSRSFRAAGDRHKPAGFWAGVIALSLNSAGFIAEIVRATVGSIERGQSEAARSIGMTHLQTLVFVLLPQALRPFVPPLTNELITLVKGSALLSVISVYELTRAGQAIISVHLCVRDLLLIALYYYLPYRCSPGDLGHRAQAPGLVRG
jgi:ABC-type amino acid transport system permease subunit